MRPLEGPPSPGYGRHFVWYNGVRHYGNEDFCSTNVHPSLKNLIHWREPVITTGRFQPFDGIFRSSSQQLSLRLNLLSGFLALPLCYFQRISEITFIQGWREPMIWRLGTLLPFSFHSSSQLVSKLTHRIHGFNGERLYIGEGERFD
jgi:hypothetical protein